MTTPVTTPRPFVARYHAVAALLLCLLALRGIAPATAAPSLLGIEPGADYRLTLTFLNTSATESIARTVVRVTDAPGWLEAVRVQVPTAGPLPPGAELRANITFRVSTSAPEGMAGRLVVALDVPADTFIDVPEQQIPLVVRADAADRVAMDTCSATGCKAPLPNVIGMRLRDAVARLDAAGYAASPVLGTGAPAPDRAGIVTFVRPLGGDRVQLEVYGPHAASAVAEAGGEGSSSEAAESAEGSTAKDRALAPVPSLAALRLPSAKDRLAQSGLVMRPRLGEAPRNARDAQTVYRQSPAAGERVTPGSTVEVWVYGAAPVVAANDPPPPPPPPPTRSGAGGAAGGSTDLSVLRIPASIGNYVPLRLQYADGSRWGRANDMSPSRIVRLNAASASGGLLSIRRPGDRWPFIVVPRPMGEGQTRHTYAGGQRLLVTYARRGSDGRRRADLGPSAHIFWTSPGLVARWPDDYRPLYYVGVDGITNCSQQSVVVERPTSGYNNGYVRVYSPDRVASVYFTWDDNDLAGGVSAEALEEAGRQILSQIGERAVRCQ